MAMKGVPLSQPTVLTGILPIELLNYILQYHAAPTTLIVCSSREAFLLALTQQSHSSASQLAETGAPENSSQSENLQRLLIPTIHLLSTSQNISLAFCPTLQHLRAYLAVYQRPTTPPNPPHTTPRGTIPILALLSAVSLHRSTPDLSAQGLSRTFASAVEAAAAERMILIVAECDSVSNEISPGSEQWEEQVPLLNRMLRGLGTEDRGWAGRTVKIRRILERWCVFREYEADNDVDSNEEHNDIDYKAA